MTTIAKGQVGLWKGKSKSKTNLFLSTATLIRLRLPGPIEDGAGDNP